MLITVQGGVYPAPCVLSISCRSYVQGKGCTLERLSTAGGRRGSKLARGVCFAPPSRKHSLPTDRLPCNYHLAWDPSRLMETAFDRKSPSSSIFLYPTDFLHLAKYCARCQKPQDAYFLHKYYTVTRCL